MFVDRIKKRYVALIHNIEKAANAHFAATLIECKQPSGDMGDWRNEDALRLERSDRKIISVQARDPLPNLGRSGEMQTRYIQTVVSKDIRVRVSWPVPMQGWPSGEGT